MTLFGIFGIALGLFMASFAFVQATQQRIVVFVVAYLLHVGMSFFYYSLVVTGGGDAIMYYDDPMRIYGTGFTFGTVFVAYLTQAIKSVVGGSLLDYFFLYQAFGFLGLVALMRSFEEVFETVGVEQPKHIFLLIFIPGLHYWSSAVGKDSLFFAAACVSVWASLRFKERIIPMAFAVLLMGLIRPHIAAIALVALALMAVTDRKTNLFVRLFLGIVAAAGAAYSLGTISASYQVNLASAEGISNQLAGREALLQGDSTGNTAVDAIYPLRVLSLLFRPFFVDANGLLGVIVSVENAFLVIIVGSFLRHRRTTWHLMKTVPFVRFALLSSVGALLALSITYYNVGLGIRQKATMILPGILVAYAALRAVLMARAQQERPIAPVATGSTLVMAGVPKQVAIAQGRSGTANR